MPSITYWDSIVASDDRRQQLGITNFDNKFVPMYLENSTSLNPEFVAVLDDERLTSFRATMRFGTATLRRENRKIVNDKPRFYWYAYKKVKGKLNKAYLGLSHQFSEGMLDVVVEEVNKPQEVTQNECVTDKTKPIAPGVSLELAGHQKYANQLQTNLIPVDEELSMVKNELAALKATLAMNQQDYSVLHEQCRQAQRDRLKIIQEKDAALERLKCIPVAGVIASERIQFLEEHLAFKKKEHEAEIEHFKLGHRIKSEKVTEQQNYINQLLVKNDDLDYKLKRSKEKIEKLSLVTPIIEKYRDLTKGKDKRNHPRYAYMIDFLAEIDNLS